MSSKTKRKDGNNKFGQHVRTIEDMDEDEDIKSEIEAMTNLEYNLHSDVLEEIRGDSVPETQLFTVKKPRNPNLKENSNKPGTMEKVSKFENDNTTTQTYVQGASVDELQALIRQPAITSEDKYKILDARDRLMRGRQVKSQQHLSMAKATRGVCPDMCPEKERLMREFQRQVASYELMDGGNSEYRINHETAVKQYSRSSADQEEPLPQDLRPVRSLKMTMSYLLHEIADLCEHSSTNLAEWFHFLWDRTRGIRKDITQQELGCLDSVELVEQCARFHIVCAERLCAEEPSVFDKKINTENLTKCLQTLKYMYQDLRIKGIECKNEPEFRAYIILLNLNNGNFMWDVQRLPSSVQKSPQVRFAIEVYSCIESNNYAKFFRLVRETTYTNACILLRYFNQVRVRALSVMVKAYCRTSSMAFPLYELMDILGFEDENEAVLFCEQVGLTLSNDELHIMLDRRSFRPVSNIEQGRASNYVEAKRTSAGSSIGLCIAGQKMPEKLYRGHRPHDSFDAHGYLKPESINAADQNVSKEEPDTRDNDPYEYMEEDLPQSVITFSPQKSKRFQETSEAETPKTTAISIAVTSTVNFASTSTKSTASLFPTNANSPFGKVESNSSEAGVPRTKTMWESTISNSPKKNETFTSFAQTGENKFLISKFSIDPTLNTNADQRDNSPFISGSKIFGNNTPKVPNIFAKPADDTTLAPMGIFGKTIRGGNIFGNSTTIATSVSSSNASVFSRPSTGAFGVPPEVRPPIFSGGTAKSSEPREEIPTEKEIAQLRKETLRAKLELEKKEAARRIEQETNESYAQLEKQLIEDVCKSMIREELDRVNLYEDMSEKILAEILDECVSQDCVNILKHEILLDRKLAQLAKRTRSRMILKYYRIWRDLTRRKRQQRGALDRTPVWLQKVSVEECAKSLYREHQRLAIENMRRKRMKLSEEDHELEYLEPVESKIYEGMRENARMLEVRLQPNIYWKMLISWPPMENRPIFSRYQKIMKEYICPSDRDRLSIVKSYRPNSYETLHMCITNLEDSDLKEESLSGTDGLLFVATSCENTLDVVQRLERTITSRQKLMPIPVMAVVLAEARVSPRNVKLESRLDRLLETGYVSEYAVHYEEIVDEKTVLKLIQNAVLWLTVNKSPPIPLEMDYFARVVDACLSEDLWLRILGDSSFNEHLENALRDVEFVIDLHNEAVAHLSDIFLDPESLAYTDFPVEFKALLPNEDQLPCGYEKFDSTWKTRERRIRLEQDMDGLLLPKWTFGWPIEDAMELEKCYVRYFRECFSELCATGNVFLNISTAGKTSFVQLLLEILKVKISHLEPRETVVYNKNHVRHFRNSPWWFKSSTLTTYYEKLGRNRHTVVPRPDKIVDQTTEQEQLLEQEKIHDIEKVINEYEIVSQRLTDHVLLSPAFRNERKKHISNLRDMSEQLEKSLAEQKSRSRFLDEKLALALENFDEFNDIP
ncbi:uncharacterized protein xmas [Venturia canescens]|uniref:uncharacterized protein xmas n=1 Tax=Venturia canescens TaxID=32260 RepID=UPI001C9C5EC6|nr:uncharacterized protein LOC122413657 [Venturia canescens]